MSDSEVDARQERLISRLIRSSGHAPVPPPGARERVYAAVRSEWEQAIDAPSAAVSRRPGVAAPRRAASYNWRPAFFRGAVLVGAAAAVVLAVTVFIRPATETGIVQVAVVEKVIGSVTAADDVAGAATSEMSVGSLVHVGQRLSTGADGGAALILTSGEALRLDANTTVLLAESRVELMTGAVYLDDDTPGAASSALVIGSTFGDVRHIGTQYEARIQQGALRVRVREGAVAIDGASGEILGRAGEEVLVPAAGDVTRSEIAATDQSWAWTEALAALPAANEYAMIDLLGWIARQTGRSLRFESDAARDEAAGLVLRGLGGLSPDEVIDVIGNTTALTYQVTAESLTVVD